MELKLPWQLLNFADPSRMTIHDDYYENYGVDYITIDTMYLGLTDGEDEGRAAPAHPPRLGAGAHGQLYHERPGPRTIHSAKALAVKHTRKGRAPVPVEILIYIYLGMCAGMILFNIATALLSRRREHRSFRDGIRLELTVSRELDRLAETGAVSERHLRFMERRLRRVNGMAAFDAALERLCVRRPELTRSYLTALNGVTITLAEDYCRRDEIEAAYFPYIIRKYRLLDGKENEALKTMLLDLLHESSIYCRENAMQALYTAGDPAVLVRALRIIDASSLYYHSKLLSDGLLNYTGDTWELADALWEAFDAFQPWMQVTLLNYFRFSSGAYCEKIHALLNDPAQDDEVRFACLRYLGRYPYPPAYADLLRYATPPENARWEYAAIASFVLASYPGAETAAVLKRNLYHPNWYIRFNASKSLEQLGFGYRDLIDVIEGHDRYASEILRYRFDVRELEERKEDAVCTTV